MYAVVQTGGKQYKVAVGQTLDIERLPAEKGSTIELDKVLMISDEDNITIGKPVIDGAKVLATVVGERRGEKIIVFKYKPKVRYRKKIGHRQYYTRVAIKEIVSGS